MEKYITLEQVVDDYKNNKRSGSFFQTGLNPVWMDGQSYAKDVVITEDIEHEVVELNLIEDKSK